MLLLRKLLVVLILLAAVPAGAQQAKAADIRPADAGPSVLPQLLVFHLTHDELMLVAAALAEHQKATRALLERLQSQLEAQVAPKPGTSAPAKKP